MSRVWPCFGPYDLQMFKVARKLGKAPLIIPMYRLLEYFYKSTHISWWLVGKGLLKLMIITYAQQKTHVQLVTYNYVREH